MVILSPLLFIFKSSQRNQTKIVSMIKYSQNSSSFSPFSFLCSIIKIMNIDRDGLPLIDPEKIDREYQKLHQMQEKVERLKGVTYKKFTIKKSKSVFHPPCIHNFSSAPKSKPSQDDRQEEHQKKPNITNIKFGQRTSSKPESPHHAQSLKKLPAFSPSKPTTQFRKTMFQFQTELKDVSPSTQVALKRTFSERVKEAAQRDSQTILRKNSLFLVNCLKTRYRSTDKRAHIGDTNNVGNMKLGCFSEKAEGVTHYQQRFEYMQQAKQRLLMARNQADSRFSKISPFHPQPW